MVYMVLLLWFERLKFNVRNFLVVFRVTVAGERMRRDPKRRTERAPQVLDHGKSLKTCPRLIVRVQGE